MLDQEKYIHLSVEELAQEREFAAYILQNRNIKEWETLFDQYPGLKSKAKTARSIIKIIDDGHIPISEKEIHKIWNRLNEAETASLKNRKSFTLKTAFRYAAVLLLLISIVGLSYLFLFNPAESYQFTEAQVTADQGMAKLVLANGEEVVIKKNESDIKVNSANNVISIDNDSIIDLEGKDRGVSKAEMNEVIIPYGKKSKIELEDGTLVQLNAGSRIAFPSFFNNTAREVFLQGEAYFVVAHNESKPFVVNIGDLKINVLGTKFNVTAYGYDKDISTVLLEGKVSIRENSKFGFAKKEVVLRPNQKASFNKTEKTILVVDEPDANNYIAWTEGWFQFRQENLVEVLKRLERYYNVTFIVNPSFQPYDLITGKLDLKDSLQEVLTALADVAPIDFRIGSNTVIIDQKIENMPMRK